MNDFALKEGDLYIRINSNSGDIEYCVLYVSLKQTSAGGAIPPIIVLVAEV